MDAFRGARALAASLAMLSPGSKVRAFPPGKIRTRFGSNLCDEASGAMQEQEQLFYATSISISKIYGLLILVKSFRLPNPNDSFANR